MMKLIKIKLLIILECLAFASFARNYVVGGDSIKNSNSCILLNGHLASNSNALGVKYVYDFSLKKFSKLGIGFNLASEKIWFTDNVIIPQNINTTILFGTGGVNIRYQISNYLFFQPEFSVLFGKQSITELISKPTSYNTFGYPTSYKYSENKTEKSIFGAHLEQHIFYYPKKAKNLVIGLSIFERIINAKYYDGDFGINGYIGIYF